MSVGLHDDIDTNTLKFLEVELMRNIAYAKSDNGNAGEFRRTNVPASRHGLSPANPNGERER